MAPTAGVHPASNQHSAGVKHLLDHGLDHIPDQYIFPEPLRARASPPPAGHPPYQLPVIDLAGLEGNGHETLVRTIGVACQEWGFFQVVNHGIPAQLLRSMVSVAHEFFALPTEEKMKYFSTDMGAPVRYGTSFNAFQDEVLNWRDFLRHECHPLSENINLWPEKPTNYRDITSQYAVKVRSVAFTLLGAMSESLGLESKAIELALGDHSEKFILNYYPPCPNPDLALGLAPHSDWSLITVLLQDEPGLQVLHKGVWVDVNPIENALVINLGDQLQLLSNGRYGSIEHRAVVKQSGHRMSVIMAYAPGSDTIIAPLRELLVDGNLPLYTPVKFSDYYMSSFTRGLHSKSHVNSKRLEDQT